MNRTASQSCVAFPALALALGLFLCGGLIYAGAGPRPVAAQEAEDADDVMQQLRQACAEGDAEMLLAPAAERVEISLLGGSTLYSRSQALFVLQEFFEQYPPVRCEMRAARPTDEDRFVPGRCWYEGAEAPLRLYVQLEAEGGAWVLRSLRVESPS